MTNIFINPQFLLYWKNNINLIFAELLKTVWESPHKHNLNTNFWVTRVRYIYKSRGFDEWAIAGYELYMKKDLISPFQTNI